MVANNDQSNYAEMFQEWMQKSGKAQNEFIKAFCSYMENNQKFDPLQSIKDMASKASEAQTNLVSNMTSLQKNVMEQMFNFGNVMQNFTGWGAFKTSVGSNGRISIPEAERDALKIGEGDLVQVFIMPLEKKKKNA
jgi:hypothetical protein